MTFETTIIQPALVGLSTVVVGREVLAFDSLPSTNTLLREHAQAGVAEGLVAVADEQTAGRGRRGRSWSAPRGQNLLQSILLRPMWLPASDAFWLTILAAVAVHEAITNVTGLPVTLKWPNDVQIDGKKIAGILVELEASSPEYLRWAIIGCGINVNWFPHDDPTIGQPVTSLAQELGRPCDRTTLFRAVLTALDRHYLGLRSGRREALRADWERHLATLGQEVTVETDSGTFVALAQSVDSDGALRLRLADGSEQRVLAGDVRVRSHQE